MSEQIPASPTDVLVARQPIFNRRQEVVAYELLYRSSRENRFQENDAGKATSTLIANALLSIGLDRLVRDRVAYINFDSAALLDGLATLLPPERVVVEIIETVEETEDLIGVCENLRAKGYRLALDDFAGEANYTRLLELADIIKVDFRAADPAIQQTLAHCYSRRGIRMLAEKVETPEEFERAGAMDYELFQGYFFSRPRIIGGRAIPASKLHNLRILQEVHRRELDYGRLEGIVKSEPSMVHKLLRFVNASNFGWRSEIGSVRHALALLGESEVRRWASLVAVTGLADDKPKELVVDSVVRGRVCEHLSRRIGLGDRMGEMFFLGMFSLVDAMTDRPMAEILEGIQLADDVRATLLGSPSAPRRFREVLRLAAALEKADFVEVEACVNELGQDITGVRAVYLESLEWATKLL